MRRFHPPPDTISPHMRILITAGPTREPIDPVRYIGNRSSGKMGAALVASGVESEDIPRPLSSVRLPNLFRTKREGSMLKRLRKCLAP